MTKCEFPDEFPADLAADLLAWWESKPELGEPDVEYAIETVRLWAHSKDERRSLRGWYATVQRAIRDGWWQRADRTRSPRAIGSGSATDQALREQIVADLVVMWGSFSTQEKRLQTSVIARQLARWPVPAVRHVVSRLLNSWAGPGLPSIPFLHAECQRAVPLIAERDDLSRARASREARYSGGRSDQRTRG